MLHHDNGFVLKPAQAPPKERKVMKKRLLNIITTLLFLTFNIYLFFSKASWVNNRLTNSFIVRPLSISPYLIRAEMLSMTFKRHGPTTQDNQGEPNVSFSVQTPWALG